MSTPATTIDDVIAALEVIVAESIRAGSTAGYFAALYLKVTVKVKEGIDAGFFDDGPRMERFDVIFANHYLDAFADFRAGRPVPSSWRIAFEAESDPRLIVLQHLLLGMNAHINLDLGKTAAEVAEGGDLQSLHADFNRINEILSSLVNEVQGSLSWIWPPMKWILGKAGNTDEYLVDFSMKLARDGAWRFAGEYFDTPGNARAAALRTRDDKVAVKAGLVTDLGKRARFIFRLVRLTERGSVARKIEKLSLT
jgi:hypothetical protein